MRHVTTDDYLTLVNRLSGEDLSWMFRAYLREAQVPKLRIEKGDDQMSMSWETESGGRFHMPVEVEVDGEIILVKPEDGEFRLEYEPGSAVTVDPYNRVFMRIAEE